MRLDTRASHPYALDGIGTLQMLFFFFSRRKYWNRELQKHFLSEGIALG